MLQRSYIQFFMLAKFLHYISEKISLLGLNLKSKVI